MSADWRNTIVVTISAGKSRPRAESGPTETTKLRFQNTDWPDMEFDTKHTTTNVIRRVTPDKSLCLCPNRVWLWSSVRRLDKANSTTDTTVAYTKCAPDVPTEVWSHHATFSDLLWSCAPICPSQKGNSWPENKWTWYNPSFSQSDFTVTRQNSSNLIRLLRNQVYLHEWHMDFTVSPDLR